MLLRYRSQLLYCTLFCASDLLSNTSLQVVLLFPNFYSAFCSLTDSEVESLKKVVGDLMAASQQKDIKINELRKGK